MADDGAVSVVNETRTKFFLIGEVCEEMVMQFIDPFTRAIEEQKRLDQKLLTIYIQGPGGYLDSMQTILSLMQLAEASRITVRTVAMGEVASASSMLAVAGTKGNRFIAPHAEHMLHLGQAYLDGTSIVEADRSNKRLVRHFKWIESHYNLYSQVPNLSDHLQHDSFYLTANQCLRYKLADRLIKDIDV